MSIPRKAVELVISQEGCPPRPYWPGGSSGITLGVGYDLAHHSLEDLEADWIAPGRVTGDTEALDNLRACVGLSGPAARDLERTVRGVSVDRAGALEVFEERSLPKYEAMTRRAFPGIDELPEDVQGALVSLVFNRGTDMGTPGTRSWDTRREMREVREAVARGDVQAIADAIRSMKRLWEGQGLDGLLTRRDAEAGLVESGLA